MDDKQRRAIGDEVASTLQRLIMEQFGTMDDCITILSVLMLEHLVLKNVLQHTDVENEFEALGVTLRSNIPGLIEKARKEIAAQSMPGTWRIH